MRPFVDQDTLILIHNIIVRPYFDCCCEVWNVFGETQSKRLQKPQNRAARIILSISKDVDHTIALNGLGWEPLQIERKKAKAKMTYELLNKMVRNHSKIYFRTRVRKLITTFETC